MENTIKVHKKYNYTRQMAIGVKSLDVGGGNQLADPTIEIQFVIYI